MPDERKGWGDEVKSFIDALEDMSPEEIIIAAAAQVVVSKNFEKRLDAIDKRIALYDVGKYVSEIIERGRQRGERL